MVIILSILVFIVHKSFRRDVKKIFFWVYRFGSSKGLYIVNNIYLNEACEIVVLRAYFHDNIVIIL